MHLLIFFKHTPFVFIFALKKKKAQFHISEPASKEKEPPFVRRELCGARAPTHRLRAKAQLRQVYAYAGQLRLLTARFLLWPIRLWVCPARHSRPRLHGRSARAARLQQKKLNYRLSDRRGHLYCRGRGRTRREGMKYKLA